MKSREVEHLDMPILHRAPLIVPVQGEVLENGAVLLVGEKICKVDLYDRLKGEADRVVDHEGAVLTPALLNCHAHLELSHLRELGRDNSFFEPGDITHWIGALLEKRGAYSGSPADVLDAARDALNEMRLSGVAGVIDIGNSGLSCEIGDNSSVAVQFFLEGFGLSSEEVPAVKKRLLEYDNPAWCGHAPYSTSPELLVFLKDRARDRGELFPIHTAESLDEIEFLQTGKGRFADFLSRRLQESGGLDAPALADIFTPPGTGAISYLHRLGVLDRNTLCVHSVHVNDQEIDLLAKHGSSICLCPASNHFLGVGIAPVPKMIGAGLNICLGTDSLMSNGLLSIWQEMATLFQDHPELDPELIFQMATINGATVMGKADSLGGLRPGKAAHILAIHGLDLDKGTIIESLVRSGEGTNVTLLHEDEA